VHNKGDGRDSIRAAAARIPIEDRYRLLVESIAEYAISILDSHGRFATWNQGSERIMGWAAEEIVGRHFSATFPPEDIARGKPGELLKVAAERGVSRDEGWRRRKDGSRFWASVVITAMRDEQGGLRGFAKITRDLSEHKNAEDELRHHQTLLDSIIENIPDMIFMKDAENLRYVRLNKAGEELFGVSRSEMLGRSVYDFFPKEEADFFTAKDREALAGNGVVDIPEEPVSTKHKGTRIVHTKKLPLRDATGRARYLLGLSEDVTERVATEARVRGLNAELERRTKDLTAANAELEAFSLSVAHDLRAPIRQILGFAKLLDEDYKPVLDDEARRRLDKIQDGARHMGRLVDDLLILSKAGRQEAAPEDVALDELARRTIEELQPEAAGRDVEWRLGELFTARCDPGLMKQVFANLLSNALKYTRPRARAVIEIGAETSPSGERVVFVRDNGVGFDMRYSVKLFGIFQRLHAEREFEGTGVGLATVERILRKHGGRIWAQAEPDKGATFYFTVEAPPASPGEP
jgi:PAS domain S-box-containing protein